MSAQTATSSRSSLGTGAAKRVEAKKGWGRTLTILFFVLVLLGGAAYAAYYFYIEARNPKMYFVNGLDTPMTVQIGQLTVPLGARAFENRVLEPGSYELVVTNGSGEEIAREQLEVPGFTDAVVYNVGGVALLRDSSVTYHLENTGMEREEVAYTLFQTYTTRDEVEWVFETPPQEIRVRGEPVREVHRFVGLPEQMEFDIPWGWDGSVSYLANYRHQFDDAIRMLRQVIALDPANSEVRIASRRMLRNCIRTDFFPYPWISFCAQDLGQVYGLGQVICQDVLGERCATPAPFPTPPVGQVVQPGQPGQVPLFPPAFSLVSWWPRIPEVVPGAPVDSALAPPAEGSGASAPDPTL